MNQRMLALVVALAGAMVWTLSSVAGCSGDMTSAEPDEGLDRGRNASGIAGSGGAKTTTGHGGAPGSGGAGGSYISSAGAGGTGGQPSAGAGGHPGTGGAASEPGNFVGPTASWYSPSAKTVAVCNGKWCWNFDDAGSSWRANGEPTDISTDSLWTTVQPGADGTLPWTNGGPTVAWTSYATKMVSVCNGRWCWNYDDNKGAWYANGAAANISVDSTWAAVMPAPDGTLPWSNNGPHSAWSNTAASTVIVCNGKWCWLYNDSATSPGWAAGGVPVDLSTNSTWTAVKPSPDGTLPWSGQGLGAGWDRVQRNSTSTCNGKWCWNYSVDPATTGWLGGGSPADISTNSDWAGVKTASDGTLPWWRP